MSVHVRSHVCKLTVVRGVKCSVVAYCFFNFEFFLHEVVSIKFRCS